MAIELHPTMTVEEREGWFLPDGVIGSLRGPMRCPQCGLHTTHLVVGATDRAVMITCDDHYCRHVWSVRSSDPRATLGDPGRR